MIPDFDGNGNLPPGIHESTLEEFEKRFVEGKGIRRAQIYEGMKKLIDDLRKIACKNLFIDGSFTTNKRVPRDFDACWDDTNLVYADVIKILPVLDDLDYPRLLQHSFYDADIFPAYMVEGSCGKCFIDYFQQDKNTGLPKGIIKIKI